MCIKVLPKHTAFEPGFCNPTSLSLSLSLLQGLMLVVLVAAFCDLFYTVYQQSVRQVAEYQYVTPIVLSLTMVPAYCTCMCNAAKITERCCLCRLVQ